MPFLDVERVLVTAAHPDDEVLGCGATIAKHVRHGSVVQTLFLADGVSSRDPAGLAAGEDVAARSEAANQAARILGTQPPKFANLADNRLDAYDLLELIKIVEAEVAAFCPQVVYTHFANDLNIDHALTARATMTACRPLPDAPVRLIAAFEIPSSTEWGAGGDAFSPTMFVDTSDTEASKEAALDCYRGEMRPYPHSRSMDAVRALGTWRGASAGVAYAEAFRVERILL